MTNQTIEKIQQPSLTWKLDTEKGRIVGKIDGLEAVKQAASKLLQTKRFQYLIYTANYGSELEGLIGANPVFIKSEAGRMLQEALTQDDRITGIENVQTTLKEDGLLIEFTVISRYGDFDMVQEVAVDV